MKQYSCPTVLCIAGWDGSGGAGIQADIKTISSLGCYATSALTALPVQNTMGVRSIYPIPSVALKEQVMAVMDDIYPGAIKIGMVHTSDLARTIAAVLRDHPAIPVVFDPVMVATSGHKLIEEETIQTIIEVLFPLASIITPNMDEASILANMQVKTIEDMRVAGKKILRLGCRSVLVKGGHLQGNRITSLYFDDQGTVHAYEFDKYYTNNTHGSGCTLSSAIASYLSRGESFESAVNLAQQYVQKAIFAGKDLRIGKGNGPLNHFFDPQKLIIHEMV